MTVKGLSHITLVCADLDRMEEILLSVLGARRVYDSGDQPFSYSCERFYLVGKGQPQDETEGIWIAVMQGEPLSDRSYNHIAFSVDDEALGKAAEAVRLLGLEIKPPRPRVEGEGQSLYFYDHDNHLFELHSGTLAMRLARYRNPSNA